ncbi:acetolactate synthase-1/2/3 large subunit [Desulfacinum hydrothermale DSM 13146]|uniref:Acetolactate synthase-1/2/3 large subunit n=1 Tax=Desulfacinum hydrothermale DSM 13146 TaxID=1121390 RepID=A0A1W1XCE1_9BACT|nr:thiamine pyrophosphate-binding protein [Desulfacinum hydrothermale]SMC21539.1 acetolactate synthase-1/2/3 large subunit [Desulfacinum hydrothermale DSM 13146]
MASVPEGLVRALKETGVEVCFGIPGGPWILYLEAMEREGLEFVLVANEASAGFMADVTARLTGGLAACHGTFGPGAVNLATGVGCALLDRSPLLAFTSEMGDAMVRRVTQMNINHQQLFAPLTKRTWRLAPRNVAAQIRDAAAIARSEVPGPVHVGVPADLAHREAAEDFREQSAIRQPAPPDPALLETVAAFLAEARRPLLAVGLTALRRGLAGDLGNFLSAHPMPVVLTPMAKGLIREDHPCHAGVLFHAASDELAPFIARADLVLGVGYDPVEFNYESWLPDVPLVHADTRSCDVDPGVRLAVDLVGDPGQTLRFLADRPSGAYAWEAEDVAEVRRRLQKRLQPMGSDFGPVAALRTLRQVLPSDGILTCDVGAHTHLLGQLWPTPAPGRFVMTNGWSSMGFGIPAALAAKRCLPDRPVACVTGDGGFLMMAGEIATARRLGLSVVVVVLSDRSLSLIRVKEAWKEMAPVGVDLHDGLLLDADTFLGAPVYRAQCPDSMRRACERAMEEEGPAIVEARVDGTEYDALIARSYK